MEMYKVNNLWHLYQCSADNTDIIEWILIIKIRYCFLF